MDKNKLYWHLIDEFGLTTFAADVLVEKIWSKVFELDLDYDIEQIEDVIKAAL